MKRLPFVEYKVGDKFYRSVQPSAAFKHFTELGITAQQRKNRLALSPSEEKTNRETGGVLGENGQRKISSSFQYRWDGPYTITKKFSPVLYEAIINSKNEIVHAVNMKHDPVIDELRPYLQDIANDKFNTKAHQKDIRELIVAVQEDNHDNLDFRQPQEGDLDFDDGSDDVIEPPAIMPETHSSSTLSSSSQNKRSSALEAITEYSSEDEDDESDDE